MAKMARAEPGPNQEPRIPPDSPTWLTGPQAVGPLSAALQDTLARNWIRSRVTEEPVLS